MKYADDWHFYFFWGLFFYSSNTAKCSRLVLPGAEILRNLGAGMHRGGAGICRGGARTCRGGAGICMHASQNFDFFGVSHHLTAKFHRKKLLL